MLVASSPACFPLTFTFSFSSPVRMAGSDVDAGDGGGNAFPVRTLATPTKALTDKKEYRVIQLHNGLRALLISDLSYPIDKLRQEEATQAEKEEEEDDEEMEEEEEDGSDEDELEEDCSEMEEEDDMDQEMPKALKKSASSGLKKSAAAICVGVGSFSDPVKLPGLAHFVEHMVFMGSEKYPGENSFDKFIQNSGGYDNAHTDCETTVFYFDSQRRHFQEGLDRFAQVFASPLMKQECMERERKAVDSEFEMALPSDSNRKEQMFGSLATEGHPMAKFMWGNLSSLQPSDVSNFCLKLRHVPRIKFHSYWVSYINFQLSEAEVNKMLHEFKERHYTARNITLAVQSQEELDTLESWVKDSFSCVPAGAQARETFHHMKVRLSNFKTMVQKWQQALIF